MKQLASILTAVVLLSNTGVAFAEAPKAQLNGSHFQTGINWQTNYESALTQAKETHKPLLLFFTGSDWCSWCIKLDEEVLDRREFAEAMNDTFVFVRLDYPMHKKLPHSAQNQQIRDKHDIKSYPTILILDENERVIGRTGYQAGGVRNYVAHLGTLIQGYLNLRESCTITDAQSASHNELRRLYEAARKSQNTDESTALMNRGLENDRDHYFLCEKYRKVLEEGQQPEATAIRTRILSQDPSNQRALHYKVAMIEFQTMLKNAAPEKSTAPLVAYLHQFGDMDQQNAWKVEMTISQTFLAEGQYKESLQHSLAAYHRAPAKIKPDVQKAIEQIKKQMTEKALNVVTEGFHIR